MKKLNAIFIVFLMFALTTSSVFGGTESNIDETQTSMNIKDRLNDTSLNIIEEATVRFFDKTGNELENPKIESLVLLDFKFKLENITTGIIKAGDYFTFDLPEEFKVIADDKFDINEFAYYEINTDQTITIFFKEAIEENSNIHGSVVIETELNKDSFKTPGEYEIEMPVSNESKYPLFVEPTNELNAIDKQGRLDRDRNPEQIIWDVYVNKSFSTLNNAIVEDIMPIGLELENIKVFKPIVDHNGEVVSTGEEVSINNGTYSLEGTKVKFTQKINEPYLIRYTTRIKDELKPNDGGTIEFINEAILKSDELQEALSTKATQTASYGTLIEKVKPQYDASTETFLWTLKYNYGEKTIVNPKLVDTFDPDLNYVDGSLKFYTMDNKEVKVDHTVVKKDNTIEIIINETISDGYTITYETKIDEDVIIEGDRKFSNEVVTDGKTSGNTGTATQNVLSKWSGRINYADKKIPWSISLNKSRYELYNYTLTDTYRHRGLTLDHSTFIIKNITKNETVSVDNYDLTVNIENGIETGFTLTFKGEYETTSDELLIEFETHYDFNDLIGQHNNVFVNDVNLTWTNKKGDPFESNAAAGAHPNDETIYNGSKSGKYNAVSKEISWEVNVNYNSEKTSDAKIVDVIEDGQKFLVDSLEIHTYAVSHDGHIELIEKHDLSDFDVELPNENNNKTLTIHLPNDKDLKYALRYKTSVASEVIRNTYNNTAIFTNGQHDRKLTAGVTVVNGNKFISKGGKQDKEIVKWEVNINQSQSTIRNAEIYDEPSLGQILLEDTFVLYPVIMNVDETYAIDYDNPLQRDVDYDLNVHAEDSEEQHFILKFKNDIAETYVLKYETQLNLNVGQREVSNIVKFTGNEITYESETGETSILLNTLNLGGTAVGEKGTVTIRKTNSQGQPLEGVEFEMFSRIGRNIGTRITDENGEIVYSNLIFSDYTLFERNTLEGYVISDDLFNGLVINVDAQTTTDDYVFEIENRMNEVFIKKTDSQGESLSGARFELRKVENDESIIIANDFTVEEAGKILYGLQAGDYELKEIVAPEGYIVDETIHSFTIEVDANNQEIDTALSIVNYQGSVQLTKVDEDEKVLEGVVFDLYDSFDELVLESLTTDENGQITLLNSLAPGSYYFKEVSTVDGNIVNESPLHFTISTKAVGEPEVVNVSATNFKGSVQFKKVSQHDNGLQGVEFTLYDSEDEEIAIVYSNEDGLVRVDHLSPGKYYFKETKALNSYIKNTEILEFEIAEKTISEAVLVELENFVNYQGSIKVRKTDENDKLLTNAKFKIFNDENILVKKFETVDGEFIVDGLAPGVYTLHEVEAPDGYMLSDEIVEFTVVEEYDGIYEEDVINFVNIKLIEKEPEKPSFPTEVEPEEVETENPVVKEKSPSTGIEDMTLIFNVVLIAALISLFVLSKNKKSKI